MGVPAISADWPGAAAATRVRRLQWRCRRGMRELDVVLERFAREVLPRAPAQDLQACERLLALPDPQLASYLLGGNTPPEVELARLSEAIRTYVALRARHGLS